MTDAGARVNPGHRPYLHRHKPKRLVGYCPRSHTEMMSF